MKLFLHFLFITLFSVISCQKSLNDVLISKTQVISRAVLGNLSVSTKILGLNTHSLLDLEKINHEFPLKVLEIVKIIPTHTRLNKQWFTKYTILKLRSAWFSTVLNSRKRKIFKR